MALTSRTYWTSKATVARATWDRVASVWNSAADPIFWGIVYVLTFLMVAVFILFFAAAPYVDGGVPELWNSIWSVLLSDNAVSPLVLPPEPAAVA